MSIIPNKWHSSWDNFLTEDVLKLLKDSSEHEYKKKYDVFTSQHPLFF